MSAQPAPSPAPLVSGKRSARTGGGKPKLAETIARQIEERIVAGQWAPGAPLGSEAALVSEAGVSRWTFREALRILEEDGLIVSRRGGGGGLFVAAPVADYVANGLSHYLEFMRSDSREVTAAWLRLDGLMLALADARLDAAARDRLVALAGEACSAPLADGLVGIDAIRAIISDAAANPALTLANRAFSRMAMHASWYSSLDDAAYGALFPRMLAAVVAMAQALAAGDLPCARAASADYLTTCGELIGSWNIGDAPARPDGTVERAYRLLPTIRPQRKADEVTARLRSAIFDADWPVGRRLGTEPQLMAHYGVGRSVLREAVRALERFGVIVMERGPAGGLVVAAPDPARVIGACRRHLRRVGLTPAQAAAFARCLASDSGHSGGASTGHDGTHGPLGQLLIRMVAGDDPPCF